MKIPENKKITLMDICSYLEKEFPEYEVKYFNPPLGYEGVQVKKSAATGVYIRIKNDEIKIIKVIPSPLLRVFFGGLLFFLINSASFANLTAEVEAVLQEKLTKGGGSTSYEGGVTDTSREISNEQAIEEDNPMAQYLKYAVIAGALLFAYFLFNQFSGFLEYGFYFSFYIIIYPLINIVALIGLYYLWKKMKTGFYLLTTAVVLQYALRLVTHGGLYIFGMGWLFLLIEIGILVVAYMNLKFLK